MDGFLHKAMVPLLPEVLSDDVESSLPGCDEVTDLLYNAWVETVGRRLGGDIVARLTVKFMGLLGRQLHVEPCQQQVMWSSAGHIITHITSTLSRLVYMQFLLISDVFTYFSSQNITRKYTNQEALKSFGLYCDFG